MLNSVPQNLIAGPTDPAQDVVPPYGDPIISIEDPHTEDSDDDSLDVAVGANPVLGEGYAP